MGARRVERGELKMENTSDLDILPCGDGVVVGLSRYGSSATIVETDDGDDWIKFHFQLRGSACYSIDGHADLTFDGAVAALCFHGKGLPKTVQVAPETGFAVTVLCRPQTLIDRFGVRADTLPKPIRNYLDHGDRSWFAEVGKPTPEMTMSLRALEEIPFEGMMRSAYVEARSIELLCELWSHVARSFPSATAAIDEGTLVKVERTRKHIDACFAEPLAMRNLARDVGTNETKLSQGFRSVFGMTIFEYIRCRRMEEARRLLRARRLSVTQIAFELGYEYSCNFSVAYKRHFGISPKEDRNATQH